MLYGVSCVTGCCVPGWVATSILLSEVAKIEFHNKKQYISLHVQWKAKYTIVHSCRHHNGLSVGKSDFKWGPAFDSELFTLHTRSDYCLCLRVCQVVTFDYVSLRLTLPKKQKLLFHCINSRHMMCNPLCLYYLGCSVPTWLHRSYHVIWCVTGDANIILNEV